MITQGNWQKFTMEFDTDVICHIVEDSFRATFKRQHINEAKAIRDIYENGSNSFPIMWFGCHK